MKARNWILLVITILSLGDVRAQEIVSWKVVDHDSLGISLPGGFRVGTHAYSEGYLVTYYWENLDVFVIQCGAMAEPSYLRDSVQFGIEIEHVHCGNKVFRGFEKSTGRKWGVIILKKRRVMLSYIVDPNNDQQFYDLLKPLLNQ